MKTTQWLKMVVALNLLALCPANAQLYLLDQSFTSPYDEGANINEGFRYVAQTFTAGLSGRLAAVSINIFHYGSLYLPLEVQINSVADGTPNSSVLGDTLLSSSSVSLSELIWFSQFVPVTAGSQYAIVVSYAGAPPAGYGQGEGDWTGAAGDTDYYPAGGLFASNDGESWIAISSQNYFFDQHFQTYVEPVPEPSTGWLLGLIMFAVALAAVNGSVLSIDTKRS